MLVTHHITQWCLADFRGKGVRVLGLAVIAPNIKVLNSSDLAANRVGDQSTRTIFIKPGESAEVASGNIWRRLRADEGVGISRIANDNHLCSWFSMLVE